MTRKKPVKKIGGTRRKKLPGHLQSRRLKLWGDKWARGDTLRNRQYLKKVEKSARKVDLLGDEMEQAVAQIDNDEDEGPVVHMGGDVSLEEEEEDRKERQLENDHQSTLFFLAHPNLREYNTKYHQLETHKKKKQYAESVEQAAMATANRCMNRYRRRRFHDMDTFTFTDTLALLLMGLEGYREAALIRKVWCYNRFNRYTMEDIRGGTSIPGTLKYWKAARKFKNNKDAAMKIHDLILNAKVNVDQWTDDLSCELFNRGVIEDHDLRDYDVVKLREFLDHYEKTLSAIKNKWLKENLKLFKKRGGQPLPDDVVIRIPGVPGGRRQNRT